MLHSKKSQSILQWYNALTTKGNVNSLEQFTDGSHFYEIASLQPFLLQGSKEGNLAVESIIFSETSIACNEEVITSVEEEAAEEKMETSVSGSVNADPFVIKESDHTDTQKKYDVIRKFIDDFYHVESSLLIDYEECQKGNELELAKVAVFLLSAMVQNLLSSQDKVVYNTTLLEPDVQENIRECLALVLDENMGEIQIKKSELHKVLSRAASYKGTPLRKQPPRSTPDLNDLSEGVKSVPKKRKERTSFVYENLQDSPLRNLLESPKIQYKAAIIRKELELAKLRSAHHNEENKVMEITLEKQILIDELEKRKKELEFYKKELESQREALIEKEEQEKLRDEELKDKKTKAEKFRKLIESQEEEIKQLKENNEALQEKVVDIEKKLEQDATTSLIKENNNLKDKIQILQLDNEEKAETIKALNEKIASFENELKKYHQMVQDFSVPNSRRELTGSPNVPETLSTIIYADEQSRETLERKEQELRQDLETKDERIKRVTLHQRKGETSKNKNPNVESPQITVNRLRESVHSLQKEKSILEKRLECYELKFGSSSGDISLSRDLNSIEKESDRIGSAATDDIPESSYSTKCNNRMDGQLWASVADDAQHSETDSDYNSQQLAKGKVKFDNAILRSIILQLGKKNCIVPAMVKTLRENCSKIKNSDEVSASLRDLLDVLKLPAEPSVTTRSRSLPAEEVGSNSMIQKNKKLEQKIKMLGDNFKSLKPKSNETEEKLKVKIKNLETLQTSDCCQNADLMKQKPDLAKQNADLAKQTADLAKQNAALMEQNKKLRQDVAIAQEKYINMEKLAKKKDDDVKKALIMYQRIVKLDKKDKDSKKVCGEECEKLRRRCKQLNEECLDFEQETGELKRSIKNHEGMMEHLRFEIKELKKENKELQLKLWEETSALSKNTTDRDALVLHYLKKSKHEPKKNKEKEEQKKSLRPIVKVDAYILNSENEPSTSNSVLASRSIRSSFFQVADEDDFLNESSLAEIHNGGIPEGESEENRLLELQRRNTLCPPHLQSSYPLEIQNMTPTERKYYNPEEVSFDLGRKSSLYNGKRDIHKKPKSKYVESDSGDSDDSHSFPVKKRKISETHRISVPVSKKHYRPSSSVAKKPSKDQGNPRKPSKDQGNPRKPSTPLKRVAAFVKKQSSAFITPSSVNRLMNLPRKSKMH